MKIAPRYTNPAIHVLDASRSVVVCSSLLDPTAYEEYTEDIKEEYEEVREDHYENLREKKYFSLEKARSLRLKVGSRYDILLRISRLTGRTTALSVLPSLAPEPSRYPSLPSLPSHHLQDYHLTRILPYIDWKPFFDTWQLRGRYPNSR